VHGHGRDCVRRNEVGEDGRVHGNDSMVIESSTDEASEIRIRVQWAQINEIEATLDDGTMLVLYYDAA
jgi:hypothetical protein